MDSPDDVEGLEKLIDAAQIDPKDIIGIIFTTEGDGFSGNLVTFAFSELLAKKLGTSRREVVDTVPMHVCRGLTGLMVPHAAVLTRKNISGEGTGEKRLVIASKMSRRFTVEELGTMEQVREVAKVVRELATEAGIEEDRKSVV